MILSPRIRAKWVSDSASVWGFMWARNKPVLSKAIQIRNFVIAANRTTLTHFSRNVDVLSASLLPLTPTRAIMVRKEEPFGLLF